jgi:site-specific recombinase XerD
MSPPPAAANSFLNRCNPSFLMFTSHEELRCLLSTVIANDNPRSVIDPTTFRLRLLMLYGAGLRISEALRLTFADVDLTTAVLHIRESKFYKTRLVPVGPRFDPSSESVRADAPAESRHTKFTVLRSRARERLIDLEAAHKS